MAGASRCLPYPRLLLQEPSATIEAMTSAFPSTARGHYGVQLDRIIFYSGPAPKETRRITRTDDDECPDVDMIFTDAAQQKSVATTERLNAAGGLDITGEGEPLFLMSSSRLAV
jgi:hypothetical protein